MNLKLIKIMVAIGMEASMSFRVRRMLVMFGSHQEHPARYTFFMN